MIVYCPGVKHYNSLTLSRGFRGFAKICHRLFICGGGGGGGMDIKWNSPMIVREINFTRNANYKDKKKIVLSTPLQLVQFCPEFINSLSQSSLVFWGHGLSQPGRTLAENSITLDSKMHLDNVLECCGG